MLGPSLRITKKCEYPLGVCAKSLFCIKVLSVLSNFASLLLRKRERESRLLYFNCKIIVQLRWPKIVLLISLNRIGILLELIYLSVAGPTVAQLEAFFSSDYL